LPSCGAVEPSGVVGLAANRRGVVAELLAPLTPEPTSVVEIDAA
jgi:hypothetical protein